jgi:DNA-binding transcriptional regulator YhcF (GntR family)
MENLKKLIVSPEYPQGILVDLTAEEIAQREQDTIKAEADNLAREEKELQEKARKESAIAKLKALGLTEEEVKSIL